MLRIAHYGLWIEVQVSSLYPCVCNSVVTLVLEKVVAA
jgi:hypothetical protein